MWNCAKNLMRDQENMEKGMEKGKIEGRAEEIMIAQISIWVHCYKNKLALL